MDASTICNRSRRSSVNHQLESAQNELTVIQLEKLEYEKELNELKEQNEELTKENDEFYETAEIEQQEILFLRHVSMNVDQENNDLQSQLHRYQQIVKHLRSENQSLQKENEKYKSIFEQLFEQNQKKDEIHTNNISQLENKLKQLQYENDQLRQEMSTIDNITMTSSISPGPILKEPQMHLTHLAKSIQLYDDCVPAAAQKRKYSLTIKDTNIEHFDELGTEMDHGNNECTLFMEYEEDNDHIMAQLMQFGYEEQEILEAMKLVNNKDDINMVIEYLQNQQDIDYGYGVIMEDEVKQKQEEIESLQKQNKDSKLRITKLQSKIKELRVKNQKLILKHNMKKDTKDNSCMFHFRLW